MKTNPQKMSAQQIERELYNFEWEYIALSDRAQSDEYYMQGAKELDKRKEELEDELRKRVQERKTCERCNGTGVWNYYDNPVPCPDCNAK